VLRQWSGCYDLTPDANPIVGDVDEIEGFYQASGFMGHGFMMAPIMGKKIAEHIEREMRDEETASKEDRKLFERWNLRRFKEGKLLEESMIIG
jgi:sarcosine oxidase subunit beta